MRTRNAEAAQAQVAYNAAGTDVPEQADIHIRPIDRQTDDFMAQSVQGAGEGRSRTADRHETLAAVPTTCWTGINIAAQDVLTGQVSLHTLQVGSGGAIECAQAIDHLIGVGDTVAAQFGTEIVPGRQIHSDGRGDVIGTGIACCDVALPIFERQAGRASTAHRLVDVDIVLRGQGQLVGRP